MKARYYLAPFLKSHSLHLIVGPRMSGKTTYALQMLAYPYFEGQEVNPWAQFERTNMPESIWYVDLIRPRENVLSQISQLGLAQPDPNQRTLHVLTYDQVLEIRPEPNRKDPIRFSDILHRISIATHGEMPPILIIDGFSLLLMSPSKEISQVQHEKDKLAEIDQLYLSQGGCLIGVQTHTKQRHVPGIELPGTHVLSHFVSSVTEVIKTKRERRKVTIEGDKLSQVSMYLEFDYAGRLKTASDLDPHGKVRSTTTSHDLLQMAIDLSMANPGVVFRRKDLIDMATTANITSITVDRWIKKNRLTGSLKPTGEYGIYTLHPKPEAPLLQ